MMYCSFPCGSWQTDYRLGSTVGTRLISDAETAYCAWLLIELIAAGRVFGRRG